MSPLTYMRRYGVVEVASEMYRQDERPLTAAERDGAEPDENGVLRKPTTGDSVPPLIGEAGAVGHQGRHHPAHPTAHPCRPGPAALRRPG